MFLDFLLLYPPFSKQCSEERVPLAFFDSSLWILLALLGDVNFPPFCDSFPPFGPSFNSASHDLCAGNLNLDSLHSRCSCLCLLWRPDLQRFSSPLFLPPPPKRRLNRGVFEVFVFVLSDDLSGCSCGGDCCCCWLWWLWRLGLSVWFRLKFKWIIKNLISVCVYAESCNDK